MAIPINNAIAAYRSAAQGMGAGAKSGLIDGAGEPGVDFGDMLKHVVQDNITELKKGEQMATKGALGKADLTDVVNAVSNAEVTLQAVVAVRDRVIAAYQEIMRMPM
jgi:flagellar hook-basal body complex protein FliE